MSFKCYYASDIHGSELLWRKFLNAGKFYGADVLIMGGDIAGKAVVPIVKRDGAFYAPEIAGELAFREDEVLQLERRIRDRGLYPRHMTSDEVALTHGDQAATDALFIQVMEATLTRWLEMAAERLDPARTRLYVMLGNDDEPALRKVLAASPVVVDPEDRVVDLGEGIQMMSCGFANPTPWHSPREMSEVELRAHLENLVAQLDDPSRSVFNLHVPPIRTSIDTAPVVSTDLAPVVQGGSVLMGSAGSEAVRAVIETYQPLIALHGHIHESRGVARLGRTVCVNPGSEYSEGVLHGAVLELDGKKGLKRYQLASG
ncbi:MAG: metallophosphoesterase family protein [Candidatus Dormibacteraceae bacterium]